MSEYKNIIVRMPNWVGDFVMATPVLEDLRRRFPEAKITAMSLESFAPLLLGSPYIDEIFSFSKRNEFLRHDEKRDIILRLQQGKYDLGILLTGSFSSALWFWRGKVEKRIGFSGHGRSLLLSKSLPEPREKGHEHLVSTYKRLLKPLGIALSESEPRLFVTDKEKREVRTLLKEFHVPERGPRSHLIGINPTSAYGSAKNWPTENFHKFASDLLEKMPDHTLLFFGDPSGAPLVQKICRGLPERVINLAGRTSLRELVALISICDLFITNDSGPMHIAEALSTPLIAIFGSTSELATGPYSKGRVIRGEAACAPCFLRRCPIDFRCMRSITPAQMLRAAQEMLASRGGS